MGTGFGAGLGKAISFLEKIVPPHTILYAVWILTAVLLFLPERFKEILDISNFTEGYKSYISLCFIASLIIIFINFFKLFLKKLYEKSQSYKAIDTKHLMDEEKAILHTFILNQFQIMRLEYCHPAVASLKNRNFIKHTPMNMDRKQYLSHGLTHIGRKKLSSKRFQKKITSGLDNEKVLEFINSISCEKYVPHSFQDLKWEFVDNRGG